MRAKQKTKRAARKRLSFVAELDAILRKELAAKQRKKKQAAEKRAIAKYVAELDAILRKELAAKQRKKKQAAKKRGITIDKNKVAKLEREHKAKQKKDDADFDAAQKRELDREEYLFEQAAHIESEDEDFVPNEITYPAERIDRSYETGEHMPVEIFDNSVQADAADLLKIEKAEFTVHYGDQSISLSDNQNFLNFTNMTDDIINRYYRLIEKLGLIEKGISPFVIFTRRKSKETKNNYYLVIEETELVGLSESQVREFDLGSFFFKHF